MNPKVTHCSRGHEYTAGNTRWSGTSRHCVACDRLRHEKRHAWVVQQRESETAIRAVIQQGGTSMSDRAPYRTSTNGQHPAPAAPPPPPTNGLTVRSYRSTGEDGGGIWHTVCCLTDRPYTSAITHWHKAHLGDAAHSPLEAERATLPKTAGWAG